MRYTRGTALFFSNPQTCTYLLIPALEITLHIDLMAFQPLDYLKSKAYFKVLKDKYSSA